MINLTGKKIGEAIEIIRETGVFGEFPFCLNCGEMQNGGVGSCPHCGTGLAGDKLIIPPRNLRIFSN